LADPVPEDENDTAGEPEGSEPAPESEATASPEPEVDASAEPEPPLPEEIPEPEPDLPEDLPETEPLDFTTPADPHDWSGPEPVPLEPPPEPPLVLQPPSAPPPRRQKPRKAPARRPGFLGRMVRRLVLAFLIVGVVLPVASTLIYRVVGPPVTILMVQRLFEGKGLDRRWIPLKRMSPALPYAVIAAEDARFCGHHGFDFQAMEKAMAHNQRRPGKIRGGSTISQQTAKNVFLWPQRSYVRKGLEAYFTVLIETVWGKRRIMEVYLNTVEWGPGVYGADAAARRYFGVGADRLSGAQAARLAAILPSPLKWQAAKPGPYVRKRSRRIGAASGTVRRDGLAACVR
jgi:monofunctional biosynthetic peptidoglycan transglycosylase